MRLEWLEDVVAVMETGSFNAAAKRRFVTQPAFSRRIRALEDFIGTELFDRERKPVRLKPAISDHQDDIKRLCLQINNLLYELRRQGRETQNHIIVASLHAITATKTPAIVEALSQRADVRVRLRSANRDECLAMLMTKQADLLITYQSGAEAAADPGQFLERANLGTERFVPVFSKAHIDMLNSTYAGGELPVIAYPGDAFLGQIFNEEVLPRIPQGDFVNRKVETALTLAALQFAINGLGVAWIPESLCQEMVKTGQLYDLSDVLPSSVLAIAALRLTGTHTDTEEVIWQEILDQS
jgi:DNA-binding transcriptional LysR family regulator